MSYYIIQRKYAIPGFLFTAIASWWIANLVMSIFCLVLWLNTGKGLHLDNSVNALHGPSALALLLCVGYSLVGGISLWLVMLVYWVAVERSSIPARIFWLLVTFFGLHIGAMIYAWVVWRRDLTKAFGPQPIIEPRYPMV